MALTKFAYLRLFAITVLTLSIVLTTSNFIRPSRALATHDVSIFGFAFNPPTLVINIGDTVNWTNNDGVIYTLWFVNATDHSTYLMSPPIAPGASWAYTFTQKMTLQYHCFERLWITGFIAVGETHDVAVLSVTPSNYTAYPTWKAPINITVVVENQGGETETFDVTAYRNTTAIQTQTVNNLAPGFSTTLMFTWNLSGVSVGNYTIKAVAETLLGEIETADNTLINGVVNVKFPGDASGDNFVNALDFGILGFYWFNIRGYDPRTDFNGDNFINAIDFGILGKYWFQGPP